MSIHPFEDHFLLTESGCWRPGAFATEQAARRAETLPDNEIQRLQDAANARGGERLITENDLLNSRPPTA